MSRETCAWELISDTLDKPDLTLPDEIVKLSEFVKNIEQFKGGNTEFAEQFCAYAGVELSAKALKQLMNRWRYQLEERFVYFKSSRSNGQRFLEIRYIPSSARDESAVQDGRNPLPETFVPSVPCVPESRNPLAELRRQKRKVVLRTAPPDNWPPEPDPDVEEMMEKAFRETMAAIDAEIERERNNKV